MAKRFRWFLPGKLAGSARPGLNGDLERDLALLGRAKIDRIVSLTSQPLSVPKWVSRFEVIHFAIPDMGIPTPHECEDLCRMLIADLDRHPTLLHCHGGLGRTGMMAACCLVTLGVCPGLALRFVRAVGSDYVQTRAQELFIEYYGAWLERRHASAS